MKKYFLCRWICDLWRDGYFIILVIKESFRRSQFEVITGEKIEKEVWSREVLAPLWGEAQKRNLPWPLSYAQKYADLWASIPHAIKENAVWISWRLKYKLGLDVGMSVRLIEQGKIGELNKLVEEAAEKAKRRRK